MGNNHVNGAGVPQNSNKLANISKMSETDKKKTESEQVSKQIGEFFQNSKSQGPKPITDMDIKNQKSLQAYEVFEAQMNTLKKEYAGATPKERKNLDARARELQKDLDKSLSNEPSKTSKFLIRYDLEHKESEKYIQTLIEEGHSAKPARKKEIETEVAAIRSQLAEKAANFGKNMYESYD